MSQIDAVLFDLGNVLVGWDPYRAFAGVAGAAEVDAFFADVGFTELNLQQDAGRTWAEARELVRAVHPQHVRMLDAYVEGFPRTLTGPIPGSEALVDELERSGMRLFGLTNWSAELFWAAEPAAPAIGRLSDVLVSGREGLAKPDPRIFALAIDRFGLDPSRTLFVDDAPANVEAAARLGLRTHRFVDSDGLRGALRALGVAVERP